MENHIQNIELINDYLNKRLSEKEVQDFESRLKSEELFSKEFEDHIAFLEGLKRQQLRYDINKAKQSYIKNKWFRYLGFTSGLIVLCSVIYLNVFNSDAKYLKDKVNFESEFIQSFQVSTDSIIEIVGEEGTIVQFNSSDLETSSNKPFTGGSLNVELIELVSKQDLLLANAQASSNDKWLISGGAFKIDIKNEKESLILKEGKTIYVKFPKNSNESNMELFYGERNRNGYINWNKSNIKINPDPFVIFISEGQVIDTIETMRFGGVETWKRVNVIDTIGYVSLEDLEDRYPKGNFYSKSNDTIRLLREHVRIIDDKYDCDLSWLETTRTFKVDTLDTLFYKKEIVIDSILIDLDINMASECRELWGGLTRQISKQENDTMKSVFSRESYKAQMQKYDLDVEAFDQYNKVTNSFYESISITKLGWINIDKFALNQETVNVKLNFNIKTNHNEIYLIDERNNTVLNLYNDEAELPENRSFQIIALGIKGKDIYGFKKSFRFRKNGDLKIEFKKINESQIRSFLTLKDVKVENEPVKTREKMEPPKSKETVVKEEIIKKEIAEVKIPKKQTQTFTINPTKDTSIVCKEGTKLTIKPNSFVDKNNNIVTGDIDLKVEEFYKLSDILLANLSTQSNDKLLETGGMLNLEAYGGNEPLNLRKNSTIEILFPTKKKNMKLFTGEWNDGVVNWNLASIEEDVDALIEETEVEEIIEDIDVPFSVVEQVPVYPGCEEGNNAQRKNCMSEAISKFVQSNFNTQIADDIGLRGRQRINVIFRIDKNGDIVDIRSRAPEPELELEAERVIALLPKMLPGKQRGKAVNVPYSLPIIFEANGLPSVGRSPIGRKIRESIRTERFENKLSGKDSTKVTVSETSSYILRSSKLGWINCDRFTNSNNRIKYKLKIEDAKGIIRVKMAFKSMSSVLPSRRSGKVFDFKMVPKNEDVVLIAIKQDEGKLYLDVIETKTEESPNIEFNFKEVNLESLRNELEKLNKFF